MGNLVQKYHIDYFVETWTYEWDTTQIISKLVKVVYTIELAKYYYDLAVIRFKNQRNIILLCGDSWEKLSEVFNSSLNDRCLIFLDGHYSGWETAKGKTDCPIFWELEKIKKHHIKNHIIVIDDVRLIWVDIHYPDMKNLIDFLLSINEKYSIRIQYDSLIAEAK